MRTILSDMRSFSRATWCLLAIAFLLFNLIAIARAVPVNAGLRINRTHVRGDQDRRVDRVFRIASEQAKQPFFDVTNRGLFHNRNPGMFLAVAELCVRLGARTPLPVQLLAIFLYNIGLLAFALWIRVVFQSDLAALAAVVFMTTRPFFIYHSTSIQQGSYSFLFLHLTLYAFTLFQRTSARRWLVLAWIAYFLGCQNYWMYYVSTALMIVALQVKRGTILIRPTLWLATAPIAAVAVVYSIAVYHFGGFYKAYHAIADIAVARSGDWRLQDSKWFPDREFLTEKSLSNYHWIVAKRIKTAIGVDWTVLAAMLVAPFVMAGRHEAWRRHSWLLVVTLAGLSWHLLMVQHNVVHEFTGMFGNFAWPVILASIVAQLSDNLTPSVQSRSLLALLLPVFVSMYGHTYVPRLNEYVQNIAAGKVVAGEEKNTASKRAERKRRRKRRLERQRNRERRMQRRQEAGSP